LAGSRRLNSSISRRVTEGGQRTAGGHDPDGRQQLLFGGVFEQEAAGAGAERLIDVFVEVEGGQHQDPGGCVGGRDELAGGFKAVEDRHADVHQDYIGVQASGCLDRLAAVAGFADDLDVGLGLEEHAKAGPDQPFVVGEQDADAHGGPLGSGRRARTR
jgi:hypothetical protein